MREIEAFFEKKDTSAYSQPLSQVRPLRLPRVLVLVARPLTPHTLTTRVSTRSAPRPSGSSGMSRVSFVGRQLRCGRVLMLSPCLFAQMSRSGSRTTSTCRCAQGVYAETKIICCAPSSS